jgi:alpha-amylase/alpha-mannosidase (GH57 family)
MPKLNVAFLWHMHQPCYRIPDSRVFRLPWVRLHGLKDYYDMPALGLKYPEIKMTFNLVPGLLEQLEDYTLGKATDQHFLISQKPVAGLSEEERCFIIKDFFMANWTHMVEPYPRYRELLEKRGRHFHPAGMAQICQRFSKQDILDLTVWFNLVWIDPMHFQERPELAKLKAKGQNFTPEERDWLLKQQMEILAAIIPVYKKAWDQQAIEISASQFYHPILPLLCDTDIARECMPSARLPRRFQYPADAREQVTSGLDYMEKLFDRRPKGFWPSEGSVSEEAVKLIQDAGVSWLGTDEGIWEQSLGKAGRYKDDPYEAGAFYRAHKWEGAPDVRLFFRDHQLSDLIGFAYSGWDGQAAARDLVARLEQKADLLGDRAAGSIVPVMLDGENAWECYPQDGQVFLNSLYSRLAQSKKLNCCTFSQYLEQGFEPGVMKKVFPGSWINHDFHIWIGQDEDNLAWNALLAARQEIERREAELAPEVKKEVFKELFIAEGSDWCWWYGGNFSSENLEDFDILYRSHLQRIYKLLNVEAPKELFSPFSLGKPADRLVTQPIDFVSPAIDGRVSDFYEWAGAGIYDIKQDGGTMHRAQSLLETIYFGFDRENLYLRFDPHQQADRNELAGLTVKMEVLGKEPKVLSWKLDGQAGGDGILAAFDKLIEAKIPFAAIGSGPGEKFSFYIALCQNGLTMERHPMQAPIVMEIPSEDFSARNWAG